MSAEPSSRTPSMLREWAAKACLPNGSRPGTMKITSSDIRLSTVSVVAVSLKKKQVSTSSRMARSSGDIAASPCCVPEGYVSDGARFRLAEIDNVVEDVWQGRRARQCQQLLLDQAEFQRADPVLCDELLEIRLALREQCVGAAPDIVKFVRRGVPGMLMGQWDESAIAALELVAAQPQPVTHLQILRTPAPVAVGKAVDCGEHRLVEQADRAEERLPVLAHRQPVPDQPRWIAGPRIVGPHRQIVDVMDADVVRCVLREEKSAICQPAAAERRATPLFDDVDGDSDLLVELIALEIGGDVWDEPGKVIGPVAIVHYDGKPFRIPRIGGAGIVRSHAPVGSRPAATRPRRQISRFARDAKVGSDRSVTAIRQDDRAGHKSRQVGSKENCRAHDVVRRARTAERGVLDEDLHTLRIFGPHLCIERCLDEAGADGVDAYAILAELGRERAGEAE